MNEYPFLIGCWYYEKNILFLKKRPILAGTHSKPAIPGTLSIPCSINQELLRKTVCNFPGVPISGGEC